MCVEAGETSSASFLSSLQRPSSCHHSPALWAAFAVETGSEAAGRSASGRGLYLAALLHPTWAHQICMLSGKIQLLLILISGLSVS